MLDLFISLPGALTHESGIPCGTGKGGKRPVTLDRS